MKSNAIPPEDLGKDRWDNGLKYFGHEVSIHTYREATNGKAQQESTGEIWVSEIGIALSKFLPGTPVGEAEQQFLETLHLHMGDYMAISGRQVPIGKQWRSTYASREEAERGHHNLVSYLEMFMCSRRLFDDIIAEMEARLTAFLLGTSPTKNPS